MCGIAGLINTKAIPYDRIPLLRAGSLDSLSDGMLGLLVHRGPDEVGKLMLPSAFMGSSRLSIIDLHHGTQPISNETGDIWIVYNGEIYDIEEHIAALTQKGHSFRTRTDTEVLVHLYEEYGDSFIERINGEFALCLYDGNLNRVLLVRDPFGVRPLFYKVLGDGACLFASEIKPILWACAEIQPRMSRKAVEQSLEGWTPVPPETSFEGIAQLLPGAIGNIDASGKFSVRRYAKLPAGQRTVSQEELYSLMRKSVERRLKADVPVGVYLSGGLDSAIISVLARQISRHELASFSVEFDNSRFDESADQAIMQSHAVTRHHSIRVGHRHIRDAFVPALLAAESVVFRSAFVPMFHLSRLVRDVGLKVVLTGEGADELFGGYDIFREFLIMKLWAADTESKEIPRLLQRVYHYLPEFSGPNMRMLVPFYKRFLDRMDGAFAGHRIRWSNFTATMNLLNGSVEPGLSGMNISPTELTLLKSFPELVGLDAEEQCRQTEILTLLHGYLLSTQGDRMASAHSVEVRLPFLDNEVVEFAYRQPVCSFIKDFQEKEILYSTFGPLLPDRLREKKKTPYLAPDAEIFFEGGMNDEWRAYLGADAIRKTGIFDPETATGFVDRMEKMYHSGRHPGRRDNTAFFVLLSTSILCHEIGRNLNPRPISNYLRRVISLN